jgi:phosphoglycolate phosphatase-like HAD superfamily hydrolase
VLALDFDGVLCDGRPEYFESARRAYAAVWPGAEVTRAGEVAARFAAARPVVESGWEMPVLLHALLSAVPEDALVDRHAWLPTARRLLAAARLTTEDVGRALNAARDAWFAADPEDWRRHHAFYPGVVGRLVAALGEHVATVVVTTKAERFARALLARADPRLAVLRIVGREPDRAVPKPETLVRHADEARLDGGDGLWFVEDMLETLLAVRRAPALPGARLFLAGWGYNTLEHRAAASARPDLRVLSLSDVAAPFAAWPR